MRGRSEDKGEENLCDADKAFALGEESGQHIGKEVGENVGGSHGVRAVKRGSRVARGGGREERRGAIGRLFLATHFGDAC